jgi:tRNA A-37 threonylcarbamoyl transferase component Bud32
MTTGGQSVFAALRALYEQPGGDVDFAQFVAGHDRLADDRLLADLIEAEGRIRMAGGLAVKLDRYLEAVPDLAQRITPLDAAIDVALRSAQQVGVPPEIAVDRLIAAHPGLDRQIRDAAVLDDALDPLETWSTSTETGEAAPGRDAPREIPDAIEGYRLIEEIHRGGQGIVYKAIQESTKRTVAVKVLARGKFASRREKLRFEREIRLAAELRHPGVVTIHDSGLAHGRHYYAMEHIDGRPLDAYLAAKQPSIERILSMFARICDAVGYAHERRIMHRDLKPGNILVDADGAPHLLDFGLARETSGAVASVSQRVTRTSEFTGTLAYASPEQVRGDAIVDARTDVYSLGVLLYEALTGRSPYGRQDDLIGLAHEITEAAPRRPSQVRPDLGGDLDAIVLRAMAKEPSRRYQTVAALGADIARVLRGEGITARLDSIPYLVTARYRTFVERHRSLSFLTIVVAATFLAQGIGQGIVFRLTPINQAFERLITTAVAKAAHVPALDAIRVIGFDDVDALAEVAAERGVDVEPDDIKSLRSLHGHLMEHLVGAGAGVVVWDIAFDGETPHDAAFVRGVEALGRDGVDVVAAVRDWSLDDQGRPGMSDKILSAGVRWGCVTGSYRAAEPWRVQLAVQRGRAEPMLSLGLIAICGLAEPNADVVVDIDADDESIQLNYSRPAPDVPRARRPAGTPDVIPFTTMSRRRADSGALGLRAGDTVGDYMICLPDDGALARITVPYADVLNMDDEALRRTFEGKVVIIADMRPAEDRHPHPGGRPDVPGCYAHAAAIGSMLEGISIRFPRAEGWWLIMTLAAIAGYVIGRMARRPAWCTLCVVAVALLAVAASSYAYISLSYLWNPVLPIASLVLATVLTSIGQRAVIGMTPTSIRRMDALESR